MSLLFSLSVSLLEVNPSVLQYSYYLTLLALRLDSSRCFRFISALLVLLLFIDTFWDHVCPRLILYLLSGKLKGVCYPSAFDVLMEWAAVALSRLVLSPAAPVLRDVEPQHFDPAQISGLAAGLTAHVMDERARRTGTGDRILTRWPITAHLREFVWQQTVFGAGCERFACISKQIFEATCRTMRATEQEFGHPNQSLKTLSLEEVLCQGKVSLHMF